MKKKGLKLIRFFLLFFLVLSSLPQSPFYIPEVQATGEKYFSYSSGILYGYGGSSTNPLRAWDFWNASEANGWNQVHMNQNNLTQFQFDPRVYVGDMDYYRQTPTWFNSTNEQLVFLYNGARSFWAFGGYWGHSTHVQLGNLDAYGQAMNGSDWIFKANVWASIMELYDSDFNFYASKITITGIGQFSITTLNNDYAYINVKDSVFVGGYGKQNYFGFGDSNHINVDGLEIYSGRFIHYVSGSVLRNIYLVGDENYDVFLPHFGNPITVEGLRISRQMPSPSLGIYGSNANCTLINSDIDWAITTFHSVTANQQWWVRYSFQVNATYTNGTTVQDANVTVTQNSQPVFSYLTWTNGTHPPVNLLYMKLNATGGNTPYMMNQYHLNIAKNGYPIYSKNFTLSEKTDWEIGLMEEEEAPPAYYDPVARFNNIITTVNPNQTVTFDGSMSYDPDGGSISYYWDFNETLVYPSSNYTSTLGRDGSAWNYSLVYNTVWSAGTGIIVTDGNYIGQEKQAITGMYRIYREWIWFNLTIPEDAVITSANLYLYIDIDGSTTNFDLTVQSGMPTYPHYPFSPSDYNKSNYAGNGGNVSTYGKSVGYWKIPLNEDGISWINKTGLTKFTLRSDREITGETPEGSEYVILSNSYSPKLEIAYTVHPTSDDAIASYSWASAGNYTVTLTVTDDESVTDSFSWEIEVTEPFVGISGSWELGEAVVAVLIFSIILLVIIVVLLRRKS